MKFTGWRHFRETSFKKGFRVYVFFFSWGGGGREEFSV